MIPRLSLRPTVSRHVVRVACDAASRPSPPLYSLSQRSSQTRGLHTSTRRTNDGFFGLLTTLIDSPFFRESSVSESTIPEPVDEYKQAMFDLGTLALAGQDSRKRSPTITTLSPERLTPADIILLPHKAHTFTVSFRPLLELASNIGADRPAIPSSISSSPRPTTTPQGFVPRPLSAASATRQPRVPHEVLLRAASGASDLEGVRFPAGPSCLYYHTPSAPCTPLAGALRLRILPSLAGDPKTWTDQSVREAFARGRDFCVLPGIPWHIPILTLTSGASAGAGHDAVRAMLLHERLVPQTVMRDAEREGRRWGFKRHSSRVIHRFGQPFIVDLSTKELRFYFVGRRRVRTHVFRDLCSWNMRGTNEAYQPFAGRLVCAFERSDYPAHVGTLFVTIRVLRVLSPVRRNPRYSGPQDIPLPRAGSLLARGVRQRAPHRSSDTRRGKRQWSLWLANIKTVFRGMRVLFENDSKGVPGETPRRG